MPLTYVTHFRIDFSRAEAQFDKIIAMDPYRLNDIDTLSNILYVAENRTKLSKLTHHYLSVDKDRPEVCCMVGKATILDFCVVLTIMT